MAENADLKLKIHLKEGGEKLAGIYFLVNLALFAHPRDLYIYILISFRFPKRMKRKIVSPVTKLLRICRKMKKKKSFFSRNFDILYLKKI